MIIIRITLITLFSIWCNISLSGQSNKIDSLLNLSKQAIHDSSRCRIMLLIGKQYENQSPDTALQWYDNVKITATKNTHDDDIFTFYSATSLQKMGWVECAYKGNFEKADEYSNKSLNAFETLSEKSDDVKLQKKVKKGISDCYNNIGVIYYFQGNYIKSIEHYQKSLEIKEELGDRIGTSDNLNNIGLVFLEQGIYDKTMEYYLKSLKIREELGDKKRLSSSYGNIGLVNWKQGNHDKAMEYYEKALIIKEKLGDKNGISQCYNNIGIIHKEQGNYDKAVEYYLKTIKILEELGDKFGMARCFNNIGFVLTDQGNSSANTKIRKDRYDKAIEFYLKSLKIEEELNDKNGIALVYESIASLQIILADSASSGASMQMAHLNSALQYGNKSYKMALEIEAIPLQLNAAVVLQKVYTKMGMYKDAIKYAEIVIASKGIMFNEEKTKSLTEMQTKYETEKKQQEIEKQQLVIEKQEINNRRQRNQRNFFIVGSFLLASLVLVVFSGYQQKKRSNTIISDKNVQLEQANEEIAAQRDMVTEQRDHIEKIHIELTSSIRYASYIQGAVLPSSEQMADLLGDHFVLFKPKDIVSGDFYWATKVKQWLVFCVADCTGHGVPGAFMSMLGISYLNDIVHKEQITTASEVLNRLRESVIAALKQKGESGGQKDGMDMGLCVINTETYQMQFAGSYNPCWIVKNLNYPDERLIEHNFNDGSTVNCSIIQLKPDKMPIAIHKHMEPYTNQLVKLFPGDQIYLLSDGFEDQFGGPDGKKFMVKNLREFIVANSYLPMEEQCELLDTTLEGWKGSMEQVDDITIMGIKV